MQLVRPERHHLEAYCAALRRGWSPNNLRSEVAREHLARIEEDADGFLKSLEDPEAQGGPVRLPDGSDVARLPSLRRWIWDDGFCGSIGLRWTKDGASLPATASGHVGYAVVPWRRREGLASAALRAILPLARARGLRHLDLTVDPGNVASIGVIEKVGGTLAGRYAKHPSLRGGSGNGLGAGLGSGEELLYRIDLPQTGLEPRT